MLNKIQKGERVNSIEKDPLLSAETDIVVEYNNVPGFLRRETSTQGDDKLRIAPHDGGVDTVKNVLDKFKKSKSLNKSLKKKKSRKKNKSTTKMSPSSPKKSRRKLRLRLQPKLILL